MDPNATLDEMRTLAKRISAAYDDEEGNGVDQDDANQLAELVEAMDGWLKGKGFLPKEWAPTDDCPSCGREATVQTSCCKCGAFV